EWLSITNFKCYGLVNMSKGCLFTVNINQSSCRPQEGSLENQRNPRIGNIINDYEVGPGKRNVPTFLKTSSAMPVGVEIVRSASSSIIRVFWSKLGDLDSFQMERGIRLMLAPRSAKAKHSFISEKSP
ncbi:hypothetical protein Tco_0293154, partial [Tanacetum coccineum]